MRGIGFALVEIGSTPFSVITNGRIQPRQLASLAAVLEGSDLRVSSRSLSLLNLPCDARHDLCRSIMHAQSELCRVLGARWRACHAGLQALDGLQAGVHGTLSSADELKAGA